MTRESQRGLVPLALLALYLIWGFTYVATKIALHDAAPFTLAAARSVLGAGALAAIATATGRPWPREPAAHRLAAAVGLLNVSAFVGGMILSLTVVSAGETSLLTYTQPFEVAALAALLLGERLPPRRLAGLALGFAGVALVLAPKLIGGGGAPLWGYAVMLAAAFCWALSAVLFRRRGAAAGADRPAVDVIWLTALQSAYGALPLLVVASLLEGWRFEPTLALAASLAFIGVFAAGGANLLWFWLLSRRAATIASSYVFLVPAFAVAFGALFLGEPLSPTLLAGGALTLSGIALVARA